MPEYKMDDIRREYNYLKKKYIKLEKKYRKKKDKLSKFMTEEKKGEINDLFEIFSTSDDENN